jgi:hypothetical protein
MRGRASRLAEGCEASVNETCPITQFPTPKSVTQILSLLKEMFFATHRLTRKSQGKQSLMGTLQNYDLKNGRGASM